MKDGLVVTISRQFGSGGREVSEKLAEKLGLAYYDKVNLAEMISGDQSLADKVGQAQDSSPRNLVVNPYLLMADFGTEPQHSAIRSAEVDLIKELADKGNCLIVGRGADAILGNHPNLISVFICAPHEDRVARAMRRNNLNEAAAKDLVKKGDKQRRAYYRYYTEQKWGEAENYDLCINTRKAGIDGTVAAIARFIEHVV